MVLNHVRPATIQTMARQGLLPNIPPSLARYAPRITCSSCAHAKQRLRPQKPTARHYPTGFSLSSDICGPIAPPSRQRNKYILTFIDTKTRYLITDFLPNRVQTPQRLDYILNAIKNQTGRQSRIIRTDNALEYLSATAIQTYTKHNTSHSPTIPYTPQENSLVERINSTLLNAARAALHHSELPQHHWEDAVRDATFKYNHTMHHGTHALRAAEWNNSVPHILQFHIFGQLGTTPNPRQRTTTIFKLNSRSRTVRYLYPTDDRHIMALDVNKSKTHRIRIVDFHPYFRTQDPKMTSTAAFKAFTPHRTPDELSISTPAPLNRGQARKYPDADLWSSAHNQELETLDTKRVILWTPDYLLPHNTHLIPLTMGYRYKRDKKATSRNGKHAARLEETQ